MLFSKKWFAEREKKKEIKRLKKEKFESFKRRITECPLENLSHHLENIKNNGFSQKEVKKIIVFVLSVRNDLRKEDLEKIKKIGEENNISEIKYLIFEYNYVRKEKHI